MIVALFWLIAVLSDCSAPWWYEPGPWQMIRTWARNTPTVLINPLPTTAWPRTAMTMPTVRLTTAVPGGYGRDLTGDPGDFLLVPRGAAHTFGNSSDEPARLLVLHAPAMDAYFEELHRLWASGQPPATEQERALMARFGMEPA